LKTTKDPAAVIRSISDRSLRLTCFDALPNLRTDWPGIFGNALAHEQDAPVLDFLFERLWESEGAQAEELVDRILSQPAKRPAAFLWLLEHLDKKPYFGKRNPARALGQLLRAKGLPEFSKYKAPLKRSVHELFERTPLEEHLRDRLLTALHLRFPDFRTSASSALYATKAVIAEKQAELKNLLEVEIPANRKAIEEARAHGDLRENFEYKSARQRHEYLSARVHSLDGDLSRAQPIAFDKIDSQEIRIGATVKLSSADGDGSIREITILGPWESNPDLGILSYESEAADNLLGKKLGEKIALGRDDWRIESIAPWKDAG
jgi:transcription elongation GreA/GreB family factor